MPDPVAAPADPAVPAAAPAADPAAPAVADPAPAAAADPAAPAPAADPAAPAAPEVPVEIQDFTMPEGMALDADLAGELKTFAKEKGLDQAGAQHIADLGVKMLQKQQEQFAAVRTQWAADAKVDKEYGGEQFDANLAVANKAIAQFAPELVTFLQESGLGNHPDMIRAWHRVGKAISEDKLVIGGATPPGHDVPLEKKLYPNMK